MSSSPMSSSSSIDVESLKDDNTGKNKDTVHCTFCPSKILSPGTAIYVHTEKSMRLHRMQRKKVEGGNNDAGGDETEEDKDEEDVDDYWMVDDMFIFENIGFSNTVDNIKYLICADCEMGPVGWHDLTDKKSYIALCRVKHA